MKKLKERIPLKYIYVLSTIIAILLSVGLYYTYAMFTANVSSGNIVNMDTTLKYNFDISGTQSFHIGKNSIASFYATINNTSNGTIYYEIYYSSNSDLTNVIIAEVVEDKTTTTEALNTSGNIDTGVSKDVPLVIANNSNNDIDIICNFLCNLVTRILQIIEFFIIYAYFISFNFPIFISTVIVSILMLIIYIKAGSLVQKLNIKRKSTLDNKTIMLHKLYSSLANKKNNINSIMNLFNKDNKSYLKYNHKYNVIIQGIIYLVLGTIEVSRYAIIFYAIYLVSIGNIEIGTILLIYSYYDKILTNFEVLGTITADYQSFNVSLNRLNKVTMREVIAK